MRGYNIVELLNKSDVDKDIRDEVNCIEINNILIYKYLQHQIPLRASVAILVLNGNADISINYKKYYISHNNLILLSASHLLKFNSCSNDFKALALLLSRKFTDSMDSTDMVNKRIRYEVMTFRSPIISLIKRDCIILKERLLMVIKSINNNQHKYRKELILNSIFAFFLDTSNIIDSSINKNDDFIETHKENIIKEFIGLLSFYYKEEHNVDFYASKLNISTHYLTLLVKSITGQRASDLIYEMIYSEARELLLHSKLSIQEISNDLNFSDQSSFGKFFKRRCGISPKEFRLI